MEVNKRVEYNSRGQLTTITIQTDWDSREVIDLPSRCSACPAGFSCSGDCGRNAPFQDEDYRTRPKTCKLKKCNLLDVLVEYLDVKGTQQKRYKRVTRQDQLQVGASAAFLKADGSVDVYRGKAIFGTIVAIFEPGTETAVFSPYTSVHNLSEVMKEKLKSNYVVVLQREGTKSYYLNLISAKEMHMEPIDSSVITIGILEKGDNHE